tara:strand:- start:678 stop:821 length:144 start_codon:yes stop_codon:yes gene_type:complete
MPEEKPKPAPLETEDGAQTDDNIDDLGNKTDGSKLDQPAADPATESK